MSAVNEGPHLQVGCMFQHRAPGPVEEKLVRDQEAAEDHSSSEEEEEQQERGRESSEALGKRREGRSMRRRNLDTNVKRLRDLSISCN